MILLLASPAHAGDNVLDKVVPTPGARAEVIQAMRLLECMPDALAEGPRIALNVWRKRKQIPEYSEGWCIRQGLLPERLHGSAGKKS